MNNFDKLLKINCFSTDQDARDLAAEVLESNFNCEINCVEIDPSVKFAHHAKGCTIAASKIDADTVIFQNVTIGANQTYNKVTSQWEGLGNPVIGKNVVIADGAKVVGPIIIGDNTVIGAGSVITKDIPANSIAYGVNHFKPKDGHYSPVFYKQMPQPSEIIDACQKVIQRYQQTDK